jgi:two-component system response regulator
MRSRVDVLVVDDSDSHAQITLAAVRRAAPQATVVRLKDGEQALQFIHCRGGYSSRPPVMPHVILLEVEIPFRNGLQILDALRGSSSTSAIPVIMLTATDNPLAIERSYALGSRGYIVKPADFDEYCAKVASVIERWLIKKNPIASFSELDKHDR